MLIIVAMFGNLFPEANGWVCIEGGGTESVVCGEIYGMCVKCSSEHSPTRYIIINSRPLTSMATQWVYSTLYFPFTEGCRRLFNIR